MTLAIALTLALATTACDGDGHHDESPDGHESADGEGGQRHEDTPFDPERDCTLEFESDTYVAGIEKVGAQGTLKLRILDADPAPPDKGENRLTVQLIAADDGGEIDGATLGLDPTMPEHGGHGSTAAAITPLGSEGKYEVVALNLSMAGLWRLLFTIETADGRTDVIEFLFCVRG